MPRRAAYHLPKSHYAAGRAQQTNNLVDIIVIADYGERLHKMIYITSKVFNPLTISSTSNNYKQPALQGNHTPT